MNPACFYPRRAWRLLLVALGLAGAPWSQAEGTVTNGTYESLLLAAFGGGYVRLEYSGTIKLPRALEIENDTTFDATGRNLILSGNSTQRVFNVQPGVTLRLLNLTLADGRSTNGGALYNRGTVLASDCTFSNNAATGGNGSAGANGADDDGIGHDGAGGESGQVGRGGAVYNDSGSTLLLKRCRFLSNRAAGGDGGQGGKGGNGSYQGGRGGEGGPGGAGYGGGIYSLGTLGISDCLFGENRATAGNGAAGGASGSGRWANLPGGGGAGGQAAGGVIYSQGSLSVTNSTFVANSASGGKGAAGGGEDDGVGQAGRPGGDGFGGGLHSLGGLTALNCTLHGNKAQGGDAGDGGSGSLIAGDGGHGGNAAGGALYALRSAGVTNCTFVLNEASGGKGGDPAAGGWTPGEAGATGLGRGGGVAGEGSSLVLQNCLLAESVAGGNGISGFGDAGHNLSSDDSCHFTAASSRNNTDPKLGLLGDFGGFAGTVPLLPDSPAIDAGLDVAGLATDQRGLARPQQAHFDIGAFEFKPVNLSGRLLRAGLGLTNLTLTLRSFDGSTRTVTTGPDGYFQFTNVIAGSYWLLPPTNTYPFSPARSVVSVVYDAASQTNLDFTAAEDLSGRLTRAGQGLSNLIVTLQPAQGQTRTASSDANGRYTFTDVPVGTYSVLPPAGANPFSPAQYQVAVGGGETGHTNLDFLAAEDLAGRLTRAGKGLTNVTLTLQPAQGQARTTTTDAQGGFSFLNVPAGSYRLVPATNRYLFSPPQKTVTIGGDEAGHLLLDFITAENLSGRLMRAGTGLPGLTVSLESSPGPPRTVTTDTEGRYTFPSVPEGAYSLLPPLASYPFSPATRSVLVGSDETDHDRLDFIAAEDLSGRLTRAGQGLVGLTVTLTSRQGTAFQAVTGAQGAYGFTNVPPGTYRLAPPASPYLFSPASRTLELGTDTADHSRLDFIAAEDLSGRLSLRGNALSGLSVLLQPADGPVRNVATDTSGGYSFADVPAGAYTLVPPTNTYAFTPALRSVLVGGDETTHLALDFTATEKLNLSVPAPGSVRLVLAGEPLRSYRLEGSTNLLTWETLHTANADAQGLLEFTDAGALTTRQRFFRAVGP